MTSAARPQPTAKPPPTEAEEAAAKERRAAERAERRRLLFGAYNLWSRSPLRSWSGTPVVPPDEQQRLRANERLVVFEAGTNELVIGRAPPRRGVLNPKQVEKVNVVWLPRFVGPAGCSDKLPEGFALVMPRETFEGYVLDDDQNALGPEQRLLFASIDVEATCEQLADRTWVPRTSAQWTPSEEQKKHYKLASRHDVKGDTSGIPVARELRGLPKWSKRNPTEYNDLAGVDFERHFVAYVGMSRGSQRYSFQYVAPAALTSEAVFEVDIPQSTSACRSPHDPSKTVFLAGDTSVQPGRYRLSRKPLFLRRSAKETAVVNFKTCGELFSPHFRLAIHKPAKGAPGPTALSLYGHGTGGLVQGRGRLVGDTLNVFLSPMALVPCRDDMKDYERGRRILLGKKEREAQALTRRKALLQSSLSFPNHDGPVRLLVGGHSAEDWNLDAKPCSVRYPPQPPGS